MLWECIEEMQRQGYNRTTAYGAYRKAGGNLSAARFPRLWYLAAHNPFRYKGV